MKYSNNGVSYDSDTAYNEAYNGTEWTANKPGNQYVLANYGEAADVTNVYIVKSEDILMDGGKVLPRLVQAMYGRINVLAKRALSIKKMVYGYVCVMTAWARMINSVYAAKRLNLVMTGRKILKKLIPNHSY